MDKLSVDNLFLSYGDNPILKGVSFELNPGEVVCLLGASGSGKTTLLRAVAGLEQPSSGRIELDGKVFFDGVSKVDLPVEQRSLGLVFQSYALWPHRTVADNVGYGLKLRRVSGAEQKRRVQDALDQLGLGHLATRYPHQLSGGQQQRVAIARALVYNPPVILMDEPLSNLDAKLREEARAWLRELIVTMKLSALVVTHDQSEAMAMSDRILLLNNGVIEQQGKPTEMYSSPRTLFTAEFMGNNNRIAGRIAEIRGEGAQLTAEGGTLGGRARPSAAAGKDGVALIRLDRGSLPDVPGANRIQPELTTSMFLGDRCDHIFRLGALTLRAYSTTSLEAGKRHWLELPRANLWIF